MSQQLVENKIGEVRPASQAIPQKQNGEQVITIRPRPGWHLLNLRELWKFRELLWFFAWRDVKVRYRQSLMGLLWAIVPPIILMFLFDIIFGRVARVPTGDVPYKIFVFAGLLPWMFFAKSLSGGSGSVTGSKAMVNKVYFPRLILPFSKVVVAAIDLGVAFIVLGGLMAYFGFVPGWRIIFVPFLIVITGMAALSVATILAAVNVSFRDVKHMLPFMLQVGMFATPAIYMDTHDLFTDKRAERVEDTADEQLLAASNDTNLARSKTPRKDYAVPDWVQSLLEINPMMGIISSFRSAILNRPLPWDRLAYSVSVVLVGFVFGCLYFERAQRNFADII